MGIKEDLAHAQAVRAHLEDKISMGDEDSIAAAHRAVLFSIIVLVSVGIIGGFTYGIRRRISR